MTKGKGKEQKTAENGEKGQNAGKRGGKRQKTQDKAAPSGAALVKFGVCESGRALLTWWCR